MTQTALSEQMAKLNPSSGAQQLLTRVNSEQAQARAAQGDVVGQMTLAQETAMRDAETARIRAEQGQLESEHGKLATVGAQFGRGVLDAILAPGALVGLAAEGAGAAFDSKGLEDFGRGLGQASSGDAAIEAASYLFGGGGKAGLTTAERVARDVDEQQKAWPTLSAISHTAGMVAPAALGGIAGAAKAGVAGMVAMGGMEGAATGAQAAYENNAALRDVVSSALVGGALGAGAAGIGEGLQGLIKSKALKAAARELQDDANLQAAGISRKAIGGLVDESGALDSKAADLAGELSSYRFQSGPLEGKPLMRALRTPEGIQDGIRQAATETAEALQAAKETLVQKLQANPEVLASLEQQVAQGGIPSADQAAARALTALGEDPAAFQQLSKQAQNFADMVDLIQKSASAPSQDVAGSALGAISGLSQVAKGLGAPQALAAGLLTKVAHNVVKQRAASTIATIANNLVTDTVSSALEHVIPTVEIAASTASGGQAKGDSKPPKRAAPLAPEDEQRRYREQLDKVNKAVNEPDPQAHMDLLDKVGDFSAPFLIAASSDMSAKMAQLQLDMPKPEPNIRGKAYETLSSQQVKLANSMYEATTDPMSVFSDFAGGTIDYDKVQYAWRQYPALKEAAQAGLMDVFQTRLDEKQRGAVPDSILTQLDNLFGFEGKLQPSLDRGFASRMEQLMKPEPPQPKPQSSGPLKLPGSQPTYTERLSGQRG